MDSTFRVRAVRLLAEDARLTPSAVCVLHALLAANPVALRGEPTMVTSAELIDAIDRDAGGSCHASTSEHDVLEALGEVAQARWSVPTDDGFVDVGFLDGFALSDASGLLHFRIVDEFIGLLDQISRQLQDDSSRPT